MKKHVAAIAFISLLLNTVVATLLFYLETAFFVSKFSSLTERERLDYSNPIESLFAFAFGLMLVAYVIYYGVTSLSPKAFSNRTSKLVLGIIAGISPVIILHLLSFGLSLKDLGTKMEILIMIISGCLIPTINSWLQTKFWNTDKAK